MEKDHKIKSVYLTKCTFKMQSKSGVIYHHVKYRWNMRNKLHTQYIQEEMGNSNSVCTLTKQCKRNGHTKVREAGSHLIGVFKLGIAGVCGFGSLIGQIPYSSQ